MKTRIGFVSNSSSTSFCIMGLLVSETGEYDAAETIAEGTELEVHYGCNEGDDSVYVGLSPDSMKETETLQDFKNRVISALKAKNHPNTDVYWITDGGYNG